MNVGLLTPELRGFNAEDSGIASHCSDLACALADAGHRVRVLVVGEGVPAKPVRLESGAFSTVAVDPRLPLWDKVSFWSWQLNSLGRLHHRSAIADRLVAEEHGREPFDAIETPSTGLLALRCVRRSRRPPIFTRVSTSASQLVSHNRGPSRWIERVGARQERRLALASDQVLTHTDSHRHEISRLWGIPSSRIALVPHGVALPSFSSLKLGGPAGGPLNILFVGRFEHRKGIDTLLEAIPIVLAANPAVVFTLVGRDPHGIGRQAREASPEAFDARQVAFPGQMAAAGLQAAYRNCDIFVGPSRYESFGLIYAEAMAWARPVVACRAGGVPEVVADGETGLLTPPGDSGALARALLQLVGDLSMRARFGIAGRRRVEEHFSLPRLARASAALYGDVIAQRSLAAIKGAHR